MSYRRFSRHISYERLHRLLRSCSAASSVGLLATGKWFLGTAQGYLDIPSPRFYNLQPSFLKHPVKLRTGTSDYFIFRQIMIDNEHMPLKNLSISTVLDLGANIGLASAWFLSRLSDSRVFAVEADPDNFAICRENLARYGDRAQVLHGAAWTHRTMLSLHSRACSADNWVQEQEGRDTEVVKVQGWDIPSLIEMSHFDQIDLLKIDIEGAEEHIFRADSSNWLRRVRNICIELHSPSCRESFFTALSGFNYCHVQSGELDLCTNIEKSIAGAPSYAQFQRA